jgi:cobalamin-dependent methionine synthase I
MVITANDLREAGIEIPVLVGGAALSARFAQTKFAASYGKAKYGDRGGSAQTQGRHRKEEEKHT